MVKSRTAPPTYAVAANDLQLKAFDRPVTSADAAYTFMSNKTRLVQGRGVPLQVVYTAADGAVALWFPALGEVRRGRWHIEELKRQLMRDGVAIKTRTDARICFDYSGPVPNIFAPEWRQAAQCRPLEGIRESMLDRRDGDMFGLADGRARPPRATDAVRKLDDLRGR
jgi:hypothetical protein